MRFNRLGDNVYYFDGAVNLGLVTNDRGEALLVDTGIDESVGRKVRGLLEEHGLRLAAIVITHAHADHCGGAPYLARATGARVFATRLEKGILESPILEPVYLFGGAAPPAALRNKFLLAPGVRVDAEIEPGQPATALSGPARPRGAQEPGTAGRAAAESEVIGAAGFEVEVVDLAGHALGQVGVAARGVLFCADAVVGPEIVEKHGVPLNADLAATFRSLDVLLARPETRFVPAHGKPVDDIRPLVDVNRRRLEDALDFILGLLDRPCAAGDVLAAVAERFGVTVGSAGQYYLARLTVAAYLGYLLDLGRVADSYEDRRQVFRRAM